MRHGTEGIKRFERIEAGEPEAQPTQGAIGVMTARLGEHARHLGFRVISLRASRIKASCTHHLALQDPAGRPWTVRISGVGLPHRTGHEEPHLDFVCRDGVSGFGRAAAFLDAIASGEIEWRKPELRRRRKGRK